MCAITVDILDQNVGSIGFRTEAIVADVDPSIFDSKPVDVVRIPTIGIFGQILQLLDISHDISHLGFNN